MKIKSSFLIVIAALLFCSLAKLQAQNLPVVNTTKKIFYLEQDMTDDTPLIFGYETADINSKKMIAFSSFTKDVENNPNQCVLGAYYDSSDLDIGYVETTGNFVKLAFKKTDGSQTTFFIEKKNVTIQ